MKTLCENTGSGTYQIMEVTSIKTKKGCLGEYVEYLGNPICYIDLNFPEISKIQNDFGSEKLPGSFPGRGNINWTLPEGMEDALLAEVNAQEIKKTEKEIAHREDKLERFERQVKKPATISEAQKMMHEYNELMNEGGYGYIPYICSEEEAEEIRNEIAALNSKIEAMRS